MTNKVRVVLLANPPAHPEYAMMMATDRYCEAIAPYWGVMLNRVGRTLSGGWPLRWEKAAPGRWGVLRDDLAMFEPTDVTSAVAALPPVVSSCYAEVGVLAEVRVVGRSDIR